MSRNCVDIDFEESIYNNKDELSNINKLLLKYEFSESFLIKTRKYYNSTICLQTQHNLSPYFCFYYLYDRREYDNNNWSDYNDIYKYLSNNNIDNKTIQDAYTQATNVREYE